MPDSTLPDTSAAPKGAYDRARVAALLEELGQLALSPERGRVALLVESPASGQHEVRAEVDVVPGKGFAGDYPRKSFYKGALVPGREVTAVSAEVLRVLEVDPVVVGDNLITEGFDLSTLEPGDEVQAGAVRLVRSEQPHRPCLTFRDRTSPEAFAAISRARYRGALFSVKEGGPLQAGETIRRVDAAQTARGA